ncbi:hypothetical protein [Mycobacteroides abscessus]|uniref:hypothetical protein n=1 Tax=Mycobacteroides abscessus TaxID=36809 RepID=UPI000926A91B|nr:hypothetical protein [Mycobacteroides abscessus]SHQ46080.1 Uncharacterised protein [Mycobacteroides abscessus subsp. abscessus]SKQ87214.1 Uncharacterised protein [Mycobacteroides abscessus subsp. massiliense]SLC52152.1 Uncharacterised protein [Mycobacteroides abscessus subsp. massiliense]
MSVRYEAQIYRTDRAWLVEVPRLKKFLMWVQRLDEELLPLIRQNIAEITEANPADIDVVVVDVQVPAADGTTRHLLEEIVQVQTERAELEEQALDVVRDFLADLNDLNNPNRIPVRDLGFLTQFSATRVGQLARESKRHHPREGRSPSIRPTPKPELPPGLAIRSGPNKKTKHSQ